MNGQVERVRRDNRHGIPEPQGTNLAAFRTSLSRKAAKSTASPVPGHRRLERRARSPRKRRRRRSVGRLPPSQGREVPVPSGERARRSEPLRTGQEDCCWSLGRSDRLGLAGRSHAAVRGAVRTLRIADSRCEGPAHPAGTPQVAGAPRAPRSGLAAEQQASWSVRNPCELARKIVAGPSDVPRAWGSRVGRTQPCGAPSALCVSLIPGAKALRTRPERPKSLGLLGIRARAWLRSNKLPGQFGTLAADLLEPRPSGST
jgi:hypothetical protein